MALRILGCPEGADPTERFMELLLATRFSYPDRQEGSSDWERPYPENTSSWPRHFSWRDKDTRL